ncbi:MAG: tyrosine--tRNA ligase [Actinobacteria bacterium]|nr:tyrosine--tRNA ligase [Actinomycetota bacterium]
MNEVPGGQLNPEVGAASSIPAEMREQYEDLRTGCVDALPSDDLLHRLCAAQAEGRPLRAKLGVDPTAPDIHLGHTVVLRKLRQFQDLGHTAVLIIGDYTAKVGDPSGRSKTRPRLADEEIAENAQTYIAQAGKVLDMDRVELVRNSDWLAPLRMNEVLRLTSVTTVARMLERDDFSKRYEQNETISMVEFMYPLLQGYDSVAVRADVELGGTDQMFNLFMGRTVMEAYGQQPQSIMTMPLLVGTDGVQKMSKTYGNYVGVDDVAEDMYGKIMSIPDSLMGSYWTLLTGAGHREVEDILERLASGTYHPAQAKRDLAARIVTLYHGPEGADAAAAHFDRVFKGKDRPEEIEEMPIPLSAVQEGRIWLPRLLVETGMASSNSEARRLIAQGGVRVEDVVVTESSAEFSPEELRGSVVQVGRRRFLRLR